MLKQLSNRNQRTKGFKVKLGFKIFTLIVVGIWLLYQLKQYSHDKESSVKRFENLKAYIETKKLGRKGLQPWAINKPFELDDIEENEHERDDDGDKVVEEDPEEVEDLIDEQDKEKEEQNEDEDGEDMGKQMEGMSLLEDEGEEDTHATSEKHNKENGASRVLMRVTKGLGSEFEFRGLRKVKEEEVGNSKRVGTEKQKMKILDSSNSSPKVVDNVTVEHGSFPNVSLTKGTDDVRSFGAGSNSDSLLKKGI